MNNSGAIELPLPVLNLLEKGVRMPNPFSVDVGEEVDPERISADGVVFHGGTRICGAKTLISSGTRLGGEAPCTVTDCLLGRDVELRGGFFRASVFLDRVSMGSGAQVREGCLLEEEANGNHTVGLKQTILFPFVTLGSLINFCDCLLAGGTSRKDHSEVGSSYIHFNYTPNQDKATASLLGDVPRGVMLREAPIFLGGQGGLVGPAWIGFGTVIAAGTVWRGDCPEGGKLLVGGSIAPTTDAFHPGLYGDIRRRVTKNVRYLANLLALRQWYIHVRRPFFQDGQLGEGLWRGAVDVLDGAIAERLVRFRALAEKMEVSRGLAEKYLSGGTRAAILLQQRELQEAWPGLEASLTDGNESSAGLAERDTFLKRMDALRQASGADYIQVVKSLDGETSANGTGWLRQMVGDVTEKALALVPSCRAIEFGGNNCLLGALRP